MVVSGKYVVITLNLSISLLHYIRGILKIASPHENTLEALPSKRPHQSSHCKTGVVCKLMSTNCIPISFRKSTPQCDKTTLESNVFFGLHLVLSSSPELAEETRRGVGSGK